MASIFVDEAGDPGLSPQSKSQRPYLAFGFVYCESPERLRKRLRRLLKKVHVRRKYPPHLAELKFYLPSTDLIQKGYNIADLEHYKTFLPSIRMNSINVVIREATGIFSAVVDKRKAASSWTAERLGNFVFAQTLIVSIMNNISPQNPPAILFDRGRLSHSRTQRFKAYVVNKDSYFEWTGLKRYRGSLPMPIEVPSTDEPGIWAADMVAGAFYHKYAHGDQSYAEALRPVFIGAGERLFWP